MKKLPLFITMFFIGYSSFSQQSDTAVASTKQAYLKKSKNEKTTAWILAGGGLVMSAVSLAIVINDDAQAANNFVTTVINTSNNDSNTSGNKTSLTGIFFYIGVMCMVISVPLFISAAENKRKAMSISFNNLSVPQIQKKNFVYQAVPSLTFKIAL